MKFLYEAILTPWSGGKLSFPTWVSAPRGTLCSMRLSWRKIC